MEIDTKTMKWILMIGGILVFVMGLWGALVAADIVGAFEGMKGPLWHEVLKILAGLVAIVVAVMHKE